jgi:hypothetical protein
VLPATIETAFQGGPRLWMPFLRLDMSWQAGGCDQIGNKTYAKFAFKDASFFSLPKQKKINNNNNNSKSNM